MQVYPQRGSFVFNPSSEERRALCEVSGIYEIGALTLAMEHNPEKLCYVLDEQIQIGERALDSNSMPLWAKADRLFHEAIIQLSENPFLTAAYQATGSRMAALVYRMPASRERIASSLTQHRGILSMICQKDLVRAAELLRANNIAVAELLQ